MKATRRIVLLTLALALFAGQLPPDAALAASASPQLSGTAAAIATATRAPSSDRIPAVGSAEQAGNHSTGQPAAETTPPATLTEAPATPTRVVEVTSARSDRRNPTPTQSGTAGQTVSVTSADLTVEVLSARSGPLLLPSAGSPEQVDFAEWLAACGLLALTLRIVLLRSSGQW